MLNFLKNLFFFFFNILLFLFLYLGIFFFTLNFFILLLKFFLFSIFVFLNLILSLFLFDAWNVWHVYLEFFSNINITFFSYFTSFIKVCLIFFYDFFHFLKFFLLEFFNLKNFLGIFFQFYQLLNELFFEAMFEFFDQTEEHLMLAEANWMPQYFLGDGLEHSLRLNRILNFFSFSDIMQEKIFVYRRVGILNSRFWLFRSYIYQHVQDVRFRKSIGTLVEPSRWLLDFRDLRISDYIDPWHFFSNKEIFRRGLPLRKKQYISVELMHNYHSIMESRQRLHIERAYFDYNASTFLFFEYFVVFTFFSYIVGLVDDHLQLELMSLEEDPSPDSGYMDETFHPYYYCQFNDNLESQLFSEYTFDIDDYITDDDLSWDFILAQPNTPRAHVPSDLDEFELMKEMNLLLNEFRSFSFLYPIYKLAYKLSLYKFADFFFFTDSGKGFRILFNILCYIPIGLIIFLFKLLIVLFDYIYNSPKFLKFIFLFGFFCYLFIYI